MVESVDAHISFDSGVSFESSIVTPMEPGVYRLEVSPVFSEEASFGDIIEAEKDDTGRLHFRRILSRAKLRTYRWFLSQRVVESEEFQVFCDNVMQVGGMWERALGGIVIAHVPLDSDFDPETEIERIISRVQSSVPKIYVDFNGTVNCPGSSSMSCLDLTGYGTLASLSRHQIRLREGLELTFFEPGDIEVDAEVFYDRSEPGKFTSPGRWLARFDPAKIRDSTTIDAPELQTHLCFRCRQDPSDHLRLVGRQYNENCPHCGTSVMYPLQPPEDGG